MTVRTPETSPHPAPILIVSLILALLSGCATAPRHECRIEAAEAGKVDLSTHYHAAARTLAFGPLPRGFLAQAALYRIGVNRNRIHPCQYLKIRKELYLRRDAHAKLTFTETREFYAQDGTLIASHTEDLAGQLHRSGSYGATTILPIPRSAPPGNYLIVSKLAFRRHGERRRIPLARAEASFTIVPRRRETASTPFHWR
ncbi:MAG: hypothetical protein ACYDHM_10270 [Acidiferrobacterales bacterium]